MKRHPPVPPNDEWLRAIHARDDVRPYRTDVRLPRPLNAKLEGLMRKSKAKLGRRVSKNELIVNILEQFFEKSPD